jgi:hypothetical protein
MATDDGLVFNEDGSITVTLDDKALRLRPPRVGEFKTLRNRVLGNSRAWSELLTDLRAADSRWTTEVEDDRRDQLEGEQLAVLAEVFSTLGDHDGWPTDVDNWPAWTMKPGLLAQMVNHWREVPLAHGQVDRPAQPAVTVGALPPT